MRYEVALGDRRLTVDLDAAAGRFAVDDRPLALEAREIVRGRSWLVSGGGAAHEVTLLAREPLRLQIDGVEIGVAVADERAVAARRHGGGVARTRIEIRAPMPGLLKTVLVREGDVVGEGDAVATLEAMKMENELRAPARARVERIAAAAGAKVEGGALLLVLGPAPDADVPPR